MDIYFYGQACIKLKGKTAQVFIDPYKEEFTGLKLPKDLSADLALSTHNHDDHNNLNAITESQLNITGPGEYEVKGISVTGVSTFHDTEQGAQRGRNTVYNVGIDGLNVVHLGDLGHPLSEGEVDEIGTTDILFVPVGGVYTIDAKVASDVVTQLEPKIVIPIHYALPGLKFELDPLENFLKEMGFENAQPQPKLSITKDKLPEELQVVVLSKA
ncbi:MBL fold metallo-hydrolase [Candidatus Daviesbacteria bacterium]|nr:MBL fold metallo-hydrolase [Candidatus Daviesbacteria bacterium]